MNQQYDEMRLYFNRVHPMCGELFAMAYVICGDYDDAEYVLQKVMINCWHNGSKRRGARSFNEALRQEIRRVALSRLGNAEDDWDQFGEDDFGGDIDDPVLRLFRRERTEVRRVLMLRYGCGLSLGQTGKVMELNKTQISRIITKFQKKAKRALDAESRGKLDSLLTGICRRQLAERGAEMPDIGALYRNFEAEASSGYSPVGHIASRIAVFVAVVALMAVLCGVIWGVSAIIRPAQIEESGLLTETLNEQ